MSDAALLQRRLAAFRAARTASTTPAPRPPRARGAALAERLAAAVDGEWLATAAGNVVRVEPAAIVLPIARERLARLPGQPPADARLVCLDTETTGLSTAAGTLAFLVGLGWWERDRFRQIQLLCPDHGDEVALLAALEAAIPPDAWIVTYNGRGFDWPLLVTRYRLARRAAPAHAGQLDLLPHVRRLFKHRLGDARLATVERDLLGIHRVDDVAGWEIPERFLAFVRGGPAGPLAPVVTHNAEDVRSLGRLLLHLDTHYADADRRPLAPPGDLAALARSYTRERRHVEALACLDEAVAALRDLPAGPAARPFGATGAFAPPATAHGAPATAGAFATTGAHGAPAATVSGDRIRAERARTLRRLGRVGEALAAWEALARGGGPVACRAWVEVAKAREHVLGDPRGALDAVARAGAALERLRFLGAPDPTQEAALDARRRRLRSRLALAQPAGPRSAGSGVPAPPA